MADVTLTLAAKDQGVAATLQRIQSRLADFNKKMGGVSAVSAKVQARFGGLTRSIIGLGAAYFGTSQAIGAFSKALNLGGQLDDLSKLTGAAAGEMLLLQKAFELGGSSADAVAPTISRLSRFLAEAKLGGESQIKTLQRLGLTYRDLARLSPTEQLRLLAQRLMAIKDLTLRTKAAMDIFGRSGASLIPLFKDFSGELDKASGYLGSMPEIMDRSAGKMADLGDSVAAIGDKLSQFAAGFLDSASGVNDFADSIANFDAAAAGVDFGKIFNGIAKAPELGFVAAGEILLLGVLKAGNALIDATMHAARVYADAMTSRAFWEGVGDIFAGVLGRVVNFLTRSLLSAIKTAIFEPLAKLPAMLGGGVYQGVVNQLEKVQGFFDREAKDFSDTLAKGAAKVGEAISNSMKTVPKQAQDYLGAGQQAREAAGAVDQLRQLGNNSGASSTQATRASEAVAENNNRVAQTTEQLNAEYNKQLQELMRSNMSIEEFTQKMRQLNQWMTSSLNAAPPAQQLGNTSMGQPQRQAAVESANNTRADSRPIDPATETTLQKVATFLEQLNTKLPQPVLA